MGFFLCLQRFGETQLPPSPSALACAFVGIVPSPFSSVMADFTGSDFHGEENDTDIVDEGGFNVSVWPDEIEERFIYIMEAEVNKGNRTSTTFSKPAWRAIEETLNAQTKRNYTYTQLRNKFNQLRTRQKDFANLIKETGVRWNPGSGSVSATDEVWERLYKRWDLLSPLVYLLLQVWTSEVVVIVLI
ncbi:hypothetical protein MUK42_20284 [Musa troglodytarum]|uniref:Myb/SANT-like domain-containing protein n=1 Tax=Musa troglodytarum TaxID=320322 RepID=A0A9E7K5U5_9LILI|nr:hypothetical protein MUK42_20284 [Musa troglodytarum]